MKYAYIKHPNEKDLLKILKTAMLFGAERSSSNANSDSLYGVMSETKCRTEDFPWVRNRRVCMRIALAIYFGGAILGLDFENSDEL